MSVSLFDLRQYAATGITSNEMTDYDKIKALFLFGDSSSDETNTISDDELNYLVTAQEQYILYRS